MKKLIDWNEEYLYGILKKYHYEDLTPRMKLSSHDDCYSLLYDSIIELKCRTEHFSVGGMLLEKEKYDWMMDISAASRVRNIWYINSTPIGVYKWDLLKLNVPLWETGKFNKRTEGVPVFQRKKVPKIVTFLQFEDATILENQESLLIKHYMETYGEIPIEAQQKLDRQKILREKAKKRAANPK